MKSRDSKNNRKIFKSLTELIHYHLDSEDDDDSEDELPEKSEKQIAFDKDRDKINVPKCEDFIYDLYNEPYVFPYEDYRIIGDTSEIDKVIHTCGLINIDVADIISTLSTDTLNYVTVGVGDNIEDALKQSVDNLPITTGQVGKMLFQIFYPNKRKPQNNNFNEPMALQIFQFIRKLPVYIDAFWGFAYDESLTDNIKVILIASSK